ncbi:MAG: 50S ribosomal protein L5 [Gemmatimonadetes bacterium]|nr:50S ribosomal protein L5 [Gemmatimonadota bacterium]
MRECRSMEPRLLRHYKSYARPHLAEQFQWGNPNQIPKIEKVVMNVGVGEATKNAKLLAAVVGELGVITGQKALITRARKSVSNFHLREGMPIGASVTLRKSRMYEFLDRLVSVAIPRVRDFRGLRTRSFDGRGNFTMGVREQIIFPEIDFDKVGEIHGMDITVVTSTDKDDVALALLRAMGFPFRGEIPIIIEHTAN